MIRLSEGDDGREVEIVVGKTLELALPETSGTGFKWDFISRGEPALTLEQEYHSSLTKMPGSPRTHCWRFKATVEGRARLALGYARPWETSAVRSYTLSLIIKPLS